MDGRKEPRICAASRSYRISMFTVCVYPANGIKPGRLADDLDEQ